MEFLFMSSGSLHKGSAIDPWTPSYPAFSVFNDMPRPRCGLRWIERSMYTDPSTIEAFSAVE
jgi:hypothetical protein